MNAQASPTCSFPLLADPDGYVACAWDLHDDEARLTYWIDLFRRHGRSMADEVRRQHADEPGIDQRADSIVAHFDAYLDRISVDPQRDGSLDIISICWAREAALRHANIDDAYRDAKARENEAALALLPGLLDVLDDLSDDDRAQRLVLHIFAGNVFDLGATKTLELLDGKPVDFHATLSNLHPRPWLIDDLDQWLHRWRHGPAHRSAVMFVDNAGCDIVLGMIPFTRELLRRGTDVLLTANSTPTLNDVTHDELAILIDRIAEHDATLRAALADRRLELAPSGNGVPLIDLSCISPQLAQAVGRRGIDLVVLEGMGRSVESNLNVRFTCDALKIAMIKDVGVAEVLGGQVYDLMFKYEPV